MKEIELKISFNTPAFLGNAEQQGQWRTPPFKALLRQWWRVVKARKLNYDHRELKKKEDQLFGFAADESKGSSQKSELLLRLDTWKDSTDNVIDTGIPVKHPEVKDRPCGANLYLGFGPVSYRSEQTKRSIPVDENAILSLRFPDEFEKEIAETIQLIDWFGTIGSRSRNAWGSINLEALSGIEFKPFSLSSVQKYARNWQEALNTDWAHCIGEDSNGLLLWETKDKRSAWEEAIRDLAEIKIAFRTDMKFSDGKYAPLEERHVIAYPVTNHFVNGVPKNLRNANQIRFKVCKTSDGKFFARIFHMPCTVDKAFKDQFNPREYCNFENTAWPKVHKVLDQKCKRLREEKHS
ncbi:MAG: hypothetical protein GX221_11730 [Candidatus Riflebacteria bacterium]|nr:hypothetical protein [Candidatus Riflebacteria bacterium]